jgi:hypothetical protein
MQDLMRAENECIPIWKIRHNLTSFPIIYATIIKQKMRFNVRHLTYRRVIASESEVKCKLKANVPLAVKSSVTKDTKIIPCVLRPWSKSHLAGQICPVDVFRSMSAMGIVSCQLSVVSCQLSIDILPLDRAAEDPLWEYWAVFVEAKREMPSPCSSYFFMSPI